MPYFDHSATTPVHLQVQELMRTVNREHFGNPSSIHCYGQKTRALVETARRQVARLINCRPSELIFTSSGTEANNLVLWNQLKHDRPHVVTSAIEHPAVLKTLQRLKTLEVPFTAVLPNRTGLIDPATVLAAIRPTTGLVSIMLANNEVGAIEPVQAIAAELDHKKILMHTDAVQAIGKIPVDITSLGVDFLTLSAHKFYGPKGAGALFKRQGIPLKPLISGGGQEQNLRSGTENVSALAGMGLAAELALNNLLETSTHLAKLEKLFIARIQSALPKACINGNRDQHLPGLVSITIPGLTNDILTVSLDLAGQAISNGSACSSGTVEPSQVLKALGFSEQENRCTVRISFGTGNTTEEVEQLAVRIIEIASR